MALTITTNNVDAYAYNDYVDPHQISDGIDITNAAKVRISPIDEVYYLSDEGGETLNFVETDVEMSSFSKSLSLRVKSGLFCNKQKTVSRTKTFYPNSVDYTLYSRAYPLTTQPVNDYTVLSVTEYSADITDMKVTGKIDVSGKKGTLGIGASVSGTGSISDITFTYQNKRSTSIGDWHGVVKSIYNVKSIGTSFFSVTDLIQLKLNNNVIRDMNYINAFDYRLYVNLSFKSKGFWVYSSGCSNYIPSITVSYGEYVITVGDGAAGGSPDSEIWNTLIDITPTWCAYGKTYDPSSGLCT